MAKSTAFLIYVSTAVTPMETDQLAELLKVARAKNKALDVTGMLLYKDSKFLQMLEGNHSQILDLFTHISTDPRHHMVTEIITGYADRRNFEEWTMGFCNMDEVESLPNFPDYIRENVDLREFARDGQFARRFIQSFNDFYDE